ncbi:hypothetical protein ACVITL_006567 [Rhizobium pisi]|jgi:hypothetical protein
MTPLQPVSRCALNNAELALCQRVYDRIVSARPLVSDAEREDLASMIIRSYQHGVMDEDALVRLLS